MAKKSNAYTIAILAGILAFTSLITPVAYESVFGGDYFVWMWAFYVIDPTYGDTNYEFMSDTYSDIRTWGLIGALLLLIATVALLYTGVKANKKYRENSGLWIVCGLLCIAAPIVHIIGTTGEFFLIRDYWDWLDPHFGIIGPFIAGALAIIAGAT